ncbi:Feruloyl CoA ortho-hydroxylase 1 [Glycine soja]
MVRGIVKILISKLGVSLDDSKINLGCVVNMNYYPPFPIPELTVGVGRHSDFGTIILCIFTVKEIGIVYKMGRNIIKLGEGLLKEPEDVGVDKEQILYTATRDGWIKRLRRNNGKWEN